MNGKIIYTLSKDQTIIIPVIESHPTVVVSDGFHITKPLEITINKRNVKQLHVACAIDDNLLLTGLLLLILFALVGIVSNILLFEVLSFAPIFYFLFCYYVKRVEFIRLAAK